jgi:hypothetical protein
MTTDLKDTLLIGKQATLRFKATVNQGDKYIFTTPENPIMQGVEMIGVPRTDTLNIKDGLVNLESRIMITSFDSGSYVLPKFHALHIKSNGTTDTLWYDGGNLEVTTIQIDTTTYKPFDVKDQMNYPYTVKEALPWAGILIALIVIIYLIYRTIKNKLNNRDLFGRPVVVDPPHIAALRQLERIRNEKLWVTNQKQFYTELTDALREYIENRYGITAMEQTSAEILHDLSGVNMEPKIYKELSELLSLSDLVKFAKYTAQEQECESSVPAAVRFVNATYLQEVEQEAGKEDKQKERRG